METCASERRAATRTGGGDDDGQGNPEDPEDLNDWGAELEQMTKRRRDHNERHQPKK